jgi:hypothetical protein
VSLKTSLGYFTHSLLALLWLLLPVLAMAFCHGLVNIDAPLFLDPISESQFLGEYWDTVESMWVLISMITAIAVNLLFLIIIPCLFGGMNGNAKHKQFLAGFIANLISGIGLPLFYYFVYGLDNATMWAELFPLHLVAFPVTFIAGSRFVTPAYRKAFWF